MSSKVAVQLFLQRILSEKFLQESTVDSLIRNISRGTGQDFGGKNGFIQEVNRVLSDIGYMLVRTSLNGTGYYSLKDLDCSLAMLNNQGLSEYLSSQDKQKATSTDGSAETQNYSKFVDTRFTFPEVLVFFEAISHIINEKVPLQISRSTGDYGDTVTWSKICSKHQINGTANQDNLAERFTAEKWLKTDESYQYIVPGARFYFEFYEQYDLSEHPDCVYCTGKIIYSARRCTICGGDAHEECSKRGPDGDYTCKICLSGNRETTEDGSQQL